MSEVAASPALSRRERKKERTRGEIYDAAMRLFARKGFAGATIAEICEEADVGRGTFFLHFPHKASLLHEFNDRVAESFLATRAAHPESARAELRALVDRMTSALQSDAEVMTAMLAEFFTTPAAVSATPTAGDALPSLVTKIIESGQARGEFDRQIDARIAATSFFATAAALISGAVFGREALTPEEVNRQFLQITFHGLSPTSDGAPPVD